MEDEANNLRSRMTIKEVLQNKYVLTSAILAAIVIVVALFYWWQISIGVANMPETLNAQKTGQELEPIDTSNWKTYKNETLGLEFRYPAEWYIKQDGERFLFFDSSSCNLGICETKKSQMGFGTANNDELLSVSEWMKKNGETIGIETDINFSLNNFEGIKRIYRGGNGGAAIFVIFAPKDKLKILYYFETSGDKNRQILNEILFSLKVLK